MKANISATTEAHLIRGAVSLLPFLAVYLIPFAFGQQQSDVRSQNQNPTGFVCPDCPRPGRYADANTYPVGATPTPTASCTPSELIGNGGFETGDFSGWTIDGINNSPVVSSNNSHSGTYTAFVGGNPPDYCGSSPQGPNGNSSFYQEFTVPANGGALSFWHWECSIENLDHAWQDAYITDSSGNILQTIFHQCANEQTWLNTQVNLAAYAGQSIRVKFLVHQDGFRPLTGMYVDDVSVFAPCGTPTPTPTPTPTSAPSCPPGGLRVLIVQSDGMPDATLRKDLLAEGASVVDDFDARSGTPTLEQLLGYEIVVPFSNYPYADPTTLGNNLADYLDAGRVVVAFANDWYGGSQSIQGRWLTGNYTPFNNPGPLIVNNGTLGSCTLAPLCDRVTTLNALFREMVTLASGATQAATWNDSSILMAYKDRAVALSAYIGDSSGNWSGDYGRVVMNAGRWLYRCPTPTPSPTPTPTPTPTATATSSSTPTCTGCSVTSPNCGTTVLSPPTDFIVHLSPPGPGALQASDFTVNGIPADSFMIVSGGAEIHFYFNTSPAVQGENTIHIAACAFFCAGGSVPEFTCTFLYEPSIPTPTPTPTPTTTPTSTPRPSPTPRPALTPRPRPTPQPRP